MSVFEHLEPIRLPIWLWGWLLRDIRRRGGGVGESGAFVLGRPGDPLRKGISYVCYDDLDPHAYQQGGIAFHAAGYVALSKYCRDSRMEVLCDVHTHPGSDVRQSHIDMRHPMMPIVGHAALIVPNFACGPWWSLKNVGAYKYLGNFQWQADPPGPGRSIKLSLW